MGKIVKMNFGFRLLIHKNLSETEKNEAKKVFKYVFINTNGNYGCRHESGAFWRRGILGRTGFSKKEPNITIRRMSNNRRIFAALPIDMLEGKNSPIKLDMCGCAIHRGGQKVRLKQPFNESDYEIYYEIGQIKG